MQDIMDMTPLDLARGLMEGDPATFKVGYSQENAVLAVQDLHKLTDEEADELRIKLGDPKGFVIADGVEVSDRDRLVLRRDYERDQNRLGFVGIYRVTGADPITEDAAFNGTDYDHIKVKHLTDGVAYGIEMIAAPDSRSHGVVGEVAIDAEGTLWYVANDPVEPSAETRD